MTLQSEPDRAPSTLAEFKSRMKETWEAGDFGEVAKHIMDEYARFVARRTIRPGMRVLDAACGAGHVAVLAAKAGAEVTGIDLAANLIEQTRENARRAHVNVALDQGDIEELPYDDGAFDLVMSTFGAIFAPRPERAAAELARVTRPGGKIVLTAWTPGGFVGEMFMTTVKYAPPPPQLPSPLLWGDETTARARFGDAISNFSATRHLAQMKFPFSPAGTVEFYRTYFGPTLMTFARLDPAQQEALRKDLEALYASRNKAKDGGTLVEAEFLEIEAVRA